MRTIQYDVVSVYCGPPWSSGNYNSGDISQLQRMQSFDWTLELPSEKILELGNFEERNAAYESTIVNVEGEYISTDGRNERLLGFYTDGIHGSLEPLIEQERDLFVLVDGLEGFSEKRTFAIGNFTLENYSVKGAVGDFLKASFQGRGFNIAIDGESSGKIPSLETDGSEKNFFYFLPPYSQGLNPREVGVIQDITHVASKDIQITFPMSGILASKLQSQNSIFANSFSIEVDLQRNSLKKLGERFPFKRQARLPIEIGVSANFICSQFSEDDAQRFFSQNSFDMNFDIYSPCNVTGSNWELEKEVRLRYVMRGLRLESVSYEIDVENRLQVNAEWRMAVGNVCDTKKNFWISGRNGTLSQIPVGIEPFSGDISGLANFESLVRYEEFLEDVAVKDYRVEFKDTLNVPSGYELDGSSIFQGATSVNYFNSGNFGENLVTKDERWNVTFMPPRWDITPASNIGMRRTYSGLKNEYRIGWTGSQDFRSGSNLFYVQSLWGEDKNVSCSVRSVSENWASVWLRNSGMQMNPEKPFTFNEIFFSVDPSVPTGTHFWTELHFTNGQYERLVKLELSTPSSFPISLPYPFSGAASVNIDCYNWAECLKLTAPSGNEYLEKIHDIGRKKYVFTGDLESLLPPISSFECNFDELVNGKTVLTKNEISQKLSVSGSMIEDFTNFSFFVFTKCSSGNSSFNPLPSSPNPSIFSISEDTSGRRGFSLSPSGTGGNFVFRMNSGFDSPTNVVRQIPTSGFDSWHLFGANFNGGELLIRVDGQTVHSSSPGTLMRSGDWSRSNLMFGTSGQLAELQIFPNGWSSGDFLLLENYYRNKWNFLNE